MLHKVIARTDVYIGEDPLDGGSMWAPTDVSFELHDDHGVDLILAGFGEKRENTLVQVLVEPFGEGAMHVVEIHYANPTSD